MKEIQSRFFRFSLEFGLWTQLKGSLAGCAFQESTTWVVLHGGDG